MNLATTVAKRCLLILPFLTLGACDSGEDTASLRSLTAAALENSDLSLLHAIEAAEAARPGAVVVAAEVELEDEGQSHYEVELYVDSVAQELELDPDTGEVLDAESEEGPEDEPSESEVAASNSVGWAALIAAAEAEVGGVAFEAQTEGGDDRFEIEVLTDEGIWEVELSSDGTVLEVELEDEEEWEDDEELEDDDDDDDDHHDEPDHDE